MAVVVITGSSSGFGLEGALAFARNGDTVHATMSDTSHAGKLHEINKSVSNIALEGATEALRHEVDRQGNRVALVQAALHATKIFDKSLQPDAALPASYAADSPYRSPVERRLGEIRERIPDALDPRSVGELFVKIAASDGSQLRQPADDVAVRVLKTMFAQSDSERDAFLRDVARSAWWSNGMDAPQKPDD